MEIVGIESSQIGVLLIDVQPLFWDLAFPLGEGDGHVEALMVRLEHLLMLTGWLELPLIATFEHPVADNGELPDWLEAVFPASGRRFTKKTYDCTLEWPIAQAIKACRATQWAVSGAETDVCIMQSVLGLLRMGYQVFLLEDCLFTSEPEPAPTLRRMYGAGAIPSTLKSMAYELVRSVDRTPWYPEDWIERDRSYATPFPPAFVPPEKWPRWKPDL